MRVHRLIAPTIILRIACHIDPDEAKVGVRSLAPTYTNAASEIELQRRDIASVPKHDLQLISVVDNVQSDLSTTFGFVQRALWTLDLFLLEETPRHTS